MLFSVDGLSPLMLLSAACAALAASLVVPSARGLLARIARAPVGDAAAGTAAPVRREQRRGRERGALDRQLDAEVPQALELIAACLAAGLPLRTACRAVAAAFSGPVAVELGRVVAFGDLGGSDVDAWQVLAHHPQLGPAAQELIRSVESGLRLVEGLHHHAATGRAHRWDALQVRARGVGVRSVLPLMLCFIPAFMLLGVVPTVASAVLNALG